MKVNMLEAKSQLSRLVKQALEGEDVIIASDGEPMVRLVPIARKGHLRGWGKLRKLAGVIRRRVHARDRRRSGPKSKGRLVRLLLDTQVASGG